MANNNDDIKKVLEAINSYTPADAVLTVDSETPNTDVVQEGIRITKEGIEEAWDTLNPEAEAEAKAEVQEGGEETTLTVNTPTEIKVPSGQAEMIANMLKLAGVEVNDAPSEPSDEMPADAEMGDDLPMVIPADDEEEAPLMGACASEGNEYSGKRQDAIDAGEDEFEVDGKTHKVKGDKSKTESEEVKEAKDKMVCKHCGDEIYKPKSDCECDCNDPNGDHWVKEYKESAIDEVEESIEKAWNENVTSEAVGEFADPIMDLCDELDCDPDHPIFQELVRYLDVDQIADFVSDFRRNHDMPADGPIDDDDPRYMDDENLPKEAIEGDQKMQEAFDKVDRITDPEELNLYDEEDIEAANSMSAEELKDELKGDIYHLMDMAADDFTDNDHIADEMGDYFANMHMKGDDASLSCYAAMRDMMDEDPAVVYETGAKCLKILGAQPHEANESKDNLDPQVDRIAELSGMRNPVAEAVSTTDLITKYQGAEVDVNDMNRLLKLSGMGELDESKLANSPEGTSYDEPTEIDELPSEVGKGAGKPEYINRADGQGENPMSMHSKDVEESFETALGEYRKFVAEGIMGKKTKKAKK